MTGIKRKPCCTNWRTNSISFRSWRINADRIERGPAFYAGPTRSIAFLSSFHGAIAVLACFGEMPNEAPAHMIVSKTLTAYRAKVVVLRRRHGGHQDHLLSIVYTAKPRKSSAEAEKNPGRAGMDYRDNCVGARFWTQGVRFFPPPLQTRRGRLPARRWYS